MDRTDPYSAEEQRVSDYIQELTEGAIGSGDDPIGFLIASHRSLSQVVRAVVARGLYDQMLADSLSDSAGYSRSTASPDGRTP